METPLRIHSLANTINEWIVDWIELEGDCTLSIWLGSADWELLALHLSYTALSHPLTHNLLISAIESLGGTVDRAVILDFQDNTYYAQLVVKRGDNEVALFARPFDAIMVAAIADRLIYVEDALLTQQAGSTE